MPIMPCVLLPTMPWSCFRVPALSQPAVAHQAAQHLETFVQPGGSKSKKRDTKPTKISFEMCDWNLVMAVFGRPFEMLKIRTGWTSKVAPCGSLQFYIAKPTAVRFYGSVLMRRTARKSSVTLLTTAVNARYTDVTTAFRFCERMWVWEGVDGVMKGVNQSQAKV
jgi:hypothetical protein